MRLRTQIFSGYLLMALAALAVGYVSFSALRDVAANFDAAINRTQPVLAALHDLRLQANQLALQGARSARRSPPTAAPTQGEQADPTREAAERDPTPRGGLPPVSGDTLEATFAHYVALIERYFPHERGDAVAIGEHLAAFLRTWEAAALYGDTPYSSVTRDGVAESLAVLEEAIVEASLGEEMEFREQQRSIERDATDHLLSVLFASVFILCAAIAGGAVLAGRIAKPVAALREGTVLLGRGLLDTRVSVGSDNELGELAQSFNRMSAELARSVVSREYVEAIIESMAEGVIVVNAEGRVERCNTAMRALFDEFSMGNLQGRPLDEVFVSQEGLAPLLGPAVRGFECQLRGHSNPPTIVAVSSSAVGLGSGREGRVLLVQDVTERKRQEDRLTYLASYDTLTGLPNRRLFLDQLANALARLPWNKRHAGVLFCDLDRFKFINDSLGHGIGDVLLQRVTERIREVLRPGDIVGRWAGDEFVVMLDDIADPDHVAAIAGKLVGRLAQPIQVGPHELFITVSVGTACAPQDATDAEELVKNADLAMYAAKAAGKNVFRCYETEMRSRTELRLMLEHALRHAIDARDQLLVHYQPQLNLDDSLIGFEALVRWQHPQLGLISPAQFLPAAEEAGLMAALDESVMRMACAQLKCWHDAGWPDLRMAINLSNQSFRRGDLLHAVARVIEEAGVAARSVEFELTEEIVMENVHSAVATMDQLRHLGVELSIDDFGTGYSSLSQLKRCPISLLKIDRSFISDVMRDHSDRAITNAIIALAHKLGIKVLAEGVETEEQLALLRESGCDAAQGYLLGKPMPAEAAGTWLEARRR